MFFPTMLMVAHNSEMLLGQNQCELRAGDAHWDSTELEKDPFSTHSSRPCLHSPYLLRCPWKSGNRAKCIQYHVLNLLSSVLG